MTQSFHKRETRTQKHADTKGRWLGERNTDHFWVLQRICSNEIMEKSGEPLRRHRSGPRVGTAQGVMSLTSRETVLTQREQQAKNTVLPKQHLWGEKACW